ncbi:adenine phosphoribosyltransferase [Bacteroidia bacterium]|nr:adenine phosphoribosyltransferase [Bacteroidia bacterium]
MNFSQYLRQIPDYPKPGILFEDITTLLNNAEAFHAAIDAIAAHYKHKGITKVVAIEARGFILGAAVAYALQVAFVPIRKKGKLPWKTYAIEYDLEYSKDTIEIHQDALSPADKVLIVDDILATGGTAKATLDLVKQFGISEKNIDLTFLLDIKDVPGPAKDALKQHGYFVLI